MLNTTDFPLFCEENLKIIHPTDGLVPFKLHNFQKRYAEFLENNDYTLASKFRQGGFTTTTIAWLFWKCITEENQNALVVTKTDRESVWAGKLVDVFKEHLPGDVKLEIGKYNDHTKEFTNTNSRMWVFTPTAARGKRITRLFIDEPAFIPDMDQHWKALAPALSNGGKCIAVSTPHGKRGWFYDTYQNPGEFKIFQSDYKEYPEFTPEWEIQAKQNLGELGFRCEVLQEFY